MEIKAFDTLCDDAYKIRIKVFGEEQGFVDEIDQIDSFATHFVLYLDNTPIATCRVFVKDNKYFLGRFAVIKAYRRQGIGARLLNEVEKYVQTKGFYSIRLHSQLRAVEFYKKCGYKVYGDVGLEEGYPHIWMKKTFKN